MSPSQGTVPRSFTHFSSRTKSISSATAGAQYLNARGALCALLYFLLMPGKRDAYSAVAAAPTSEDVTPLLASARCRARCLDKLATYLGSLEELGLKSIILRQQHTASLETCLQDQSCSSCIRPCDLTPSNYAACPAYCQSEDDDCHATCSFLRDMEEHGVSPITCPSPASITYSSTCISSCDKDSDCDIGFKCCNEGCGRSCQKGAMIDEQPPRLDDLQVVERKNGKSATLHWSLRNPSDRPVIYIVQLKSYMGKTYNHLLMPQDWRHVALVVDRHEVTIKEMELGHWYIFRVAAVNANGSAGFLEIVKPFKLETEPRVPSHPINLTETEKKIENGKHSVTLSWEPPTEADLPISKYKIFWSRRLQGSTTVYSNLKEHKKTVQGKITHYTFENLEPDCVYLMQVQALIQYGDTKLRSKKANMFVTTFSDDQFYDEYDLLQPNREEFEYEEEKEDHYEYLEPMDEIPKLILNLTHENPSFKDGEIKARIEWALINDKNTQQVMINWVPDVCIADQRSSDLIPTTFTATTSENVYHIFDLRFDCRYTVSVKGMSPQGKLGPTSTTTFFVRGCNDIKVEESSSIRPECPTAAPPEAPSKPLNLTYIYQIGSLSSINVRFMWNYPRHTDRPLIGWRVTWGQRVHLMQQQPSFPRPSIPESGIPRDTFHFSKNAAVTQVIPGSELEFTINDLQEATDYIFQLQALSDAGEGEPAQILLTTPQLSESLTKEDAGRGYRRGGASIERHDSEAGGHLVEKYYDHRKVETLRTLGPPPANRGSAISKWLSYGRTLIIFAIMKSLLILVF